MFSVYRFFTVTLSLALLSGALRAQTDRPLAAGRAKFLGSAYSTPQATNFTRYFNQVTPENAGKWGSIEGTRDVMNWTEIDATYQFAKTNGLLFRYHVLVWGSQQPAWIESLSAADQLKEITQWFDAVAARYPAIDYLEVVNEPTRQPPTGAGHGNYLNALGGDGATGWDWVLTAFRMARARFPTTKLVLNDYGVTNDTANLQKYLGIVRLLKAENLVDVIAVQAHYFSTRSYSGNLPETSAATKAALDALAATGLPIMITEMDVDGVTANTTVQDDALQLSEYQRIFPIFWEHPSVIGITLWGFRPGLWRDAQKANLVLADGTERSAMAWLKTYFANNAVPVIAAAQSFYVSEGAPDGANVGIALASDADGYGTLRGWRIAGGTGAAVFAIHAATGQLTVANRAALNAGLTPSYSLNLTVSDGGDTSAAQTVTVNVRAAAATVSRLVNIAARAYCTTDNGVTIGGFVISGNVPKRVLVRAVGPTLLSQGIGASEVLLDPTIEVHQGSPVIASNDNWGDNANAAEIVNVGSQIGANALDASDTKSSAMLLTLSPGVYSFIVRGKGNTSGIVLLEVYDADAGEPATAFVDIATRARCTTGNGVAIGGFVISGSVPKQVLLRAVGPTLTTQGIGQSEVLLDPTIEVHRGSPIIASNDNWAENTNAAAIVTAASRIGASPLAFSDAKSSALLLTLPAGAYSFIVKGKGDTSGIVLVEVYDAD